MVEDDTDIKDILTNFQKRNVKQQMLWIIYGLITTYEFFTLRYPQLSVFLLFSLPTVLFLDWVLGKAKNGQNE